MGRDRLGFQQEQQDASWEPILVDRGGVEGTHLRETVARQRRIDHDDKDNNSPKEA